jgi:hypothetical protein
MKKFPSLFKSWMCWLVALMLLFGNLPPAQKVQAAASPCSADYFHHGLITANETWCAGATHWMTDDVWIQAGVTLTIDPGVTVDLVEASWSNYLIVQGHLDINGTPDQPVLLTRSVNYPTQNWGGLFFDGSQGDGSGAINHAIIEHAGSNFLPPSCTGTCGNAQTAVFVKDLPTGKQVTINNSIIRDNTSKGLRVWDSAVNVTNTTFSQNQYPILIDGASSIVNYSGNTFSNNAYPYYHLTNYTVQEDAIFINSDGLVGHNFSLPAQSGLDAYVWWENTTIPAGVTMSVGPGVTLRKEWGHFLTVQGHLEAIGTQALPIRFTGMPSEDPAERLVWGGLFFDGAAGDGSGDLEYTTIERGGNNAMPPGCVGASCAAQNALFVKDLPTDKQLNIDHSSIEKSLVRGLYIVNSIVNVMNTSFSQNTYPIWIEGAESVVSYSGNNFVDNTYGYPNVNYPMPLDAIVINPDALMGHDFSLPAQSGLDFYVFPAGTRIPFGRTITVEPGVTLRTAPDKYLTVQGQLNAVGTQALPIRFSGIPQHDDLANIFNWGGLFFDGASGDGSGDLRYTTIERGGSSSQPPSCTGTCYGQIAVYVKDLPIDKQLNISNSIIENSLNEGLYVANSSTAQVNGNLIKGGRIGIDLDSNMMISNLALIDQALYGVVVQSGYSLDARHLTIARAGQIGLYTRGTSQLQNSILSRNALAIWTEGNGQATLDTNLADTNTIFKSGTVTELNTINGSAAFETDGYHIQITSDAVDKGLGGLSAMDIDGEVRPLPAGSLPDLGADEVPAGNDSIWPRVVGSVPANANPTSLDNVDFTVTFSELVTGVDVGDFVLTTNGGVSGSTVNGVSGSGSIYTVAVSTGTGDGTIRLDIVDDDTILDASTNPLGGVGSGNGDFVAGGEYTITRPTYTLDVNVYGNGSVTRSNAGPYHLNDEVILTATPDLGWSFA